MRYWFTADYHLGHANIIKYCKRPFLKEGDLDNKGQWVSKEIANKRVDQMNNTIIRNHNERVKPGDVVFHIGDFCFKNTINGKPGEGVPITAIEWEKKLNGKIIFLKGNHDKNNSNKTIIEGMVIRYGGYQLYLTHKPEHHNNKYKINLVGHVHEKWSVRAVPASTLINVGVDQWNFYPVSFEEVMTKYQRRNK